MHLADSAKFAVKYVFRIADLLFSSGPQPHHLSSSRLFSPFQSNLLFRPERKKVFPQKFSNFDAQLISGGSEAGKNGQWKERLSGQTEIFFLGWKSGKNHQCRTQDPKFEVDLEARRPPWPLYRPPSTAVNHSRPHFRSKTCDGKGKESNGNIYSTKPPIHSPAFPGIQTDKMAL